MKSVNVNGVILTPEALDELYFFQTGSTLGDQAEPNNSGLEIHLEAVDQLTNLLIDKREYLQESADDILRILGELNHLRNALKTFRVPTEREVS